MSIRTIEDVKEKLLPEISRFGGLDNHAILAPAEDAASSEVPRKWKLRIFTDHNEYSINIRLPDNTNATGDKGYLGCGATGRKPRAGEDWRRGGDLKDGPLTKKTWWSILGDIVSYEMVKLAKPLSRASANSIPR